MTTTPVIREFSYCLAHVPELVQYGSKPMREISRDPSLADRIVAATRSFEAAAAYPPNQAFIGRIRPEELASIERPWFAAAAESAEQANEMSVGPYGEIVSEALFYSLLWQADILSPPLFEVHDDVAHRMEKVLAAHPVLPDASPHREPSEAAAAAAHDLEEGHPLPLMFDGREVAWFHRDNRAEGREDENLMAHTLLENLCTKASGALALSWLLRRAELEPDAIDYVITCGEEAVGDRYQRGGGGMAKAIAQMVGCSRASGMDVKNFCAAPANAILTACALVKAGLHERVAVVGGGSLAKLGMKFLSFLDKGVPILDDCLGAMAFLITKDDGVSPIVRLDEGAVGRAPIGASASDEAVYRSLVVEPLSALGLTIPDVDRFAPELQNPEIMEHAGSGDVARKNYRKIAAMAVMSGQLEKKEMKSFVERVGMSGFAPTQGHIPSAVPYLGHAIDALRSGDIQRAMFVGKASLFLGRCTDLFDGVSFLLEPNPAA
ncbi:MAG: glycine/sarcosine/betaine reductase complex component C subunit beta [Planctomycetota bacterium]|nr:glycine/sarcosine/betaine reductase complex component C subunit beta [Planctomycetota bacterium]